MAARWRLVSSKSANVIPRNKPNSLLTDLFASRLLAILKLYSFLSDLAGVRLCHQASISPSILQV